MLDYPQNLHKKNIKSFHNDLLLYITKSINKLNTFYLEVPEDRELNNTNNISKNENYSIQLATKIILDELF